MTKFFVYWRMLIIKSCYFDINILSLIQFMEKCNNKIMMIEQIYLQKYTLLTFKKNQHGYFPVFPPLQQYHVGNLDVKNAITLGCTL